MMLTPSNKPAEQSQNSKHLATSPFKGKTGIRRLINAFGYSLEGFKAAFVHEDAFRQEVFLAIVLVPLAVYLGESPVEQALLIASVLLVLIVELLNSAIEAAWTIPLLSIMRLQSKLKILVVLRYLLRC